MTSPHDLYILWDERYMTDPDRANCLCCEDTLQEAKEASEELGYPVCITGPGIAGCLYWVPSDMRHEEGLRDMHGNIVPPLS